MATKESLLGCLRLHSVELEEFGWATPPGGEGKVQREAYRARRKRVTKVSSENPAMVSLLDVTYA